MFCHRVCFLFLKAAPPSKILTLPFFDLLTSTRAVGEGWAAAPAVCCRPFPFFSWSRAATIFFSLHPQKNAPQHTALDAKKKEKGGPFFPFCAFSLYQTRRQDAFFNARKKTRGPASRGFLISFFLFVPGRACWPHKRARPPCKNTLLRTRWFSLAIQNEKKEKRRLKKGKERPLSKKRFFFPRLRALFF